MSVYEQIIQDLKYKAKIICLSKRCDCGGHYVYNRILGGFAAIAMGTKDKMSLNRFKDNNFPNNIKYTKFGIKSLGSNKIRFGAEELIIEIICKKCLSPKHIEVDLQKLNGYDSLSSLTKDQRAAFDIE
jgi:hypothetical protein